jgi:hypothetical protein
LFSLRWGNEAADDLGGIMSKRTMRLLIVVLDIASMIV